MKILWLSHLIPYPPKGGVLQRSYHLVNELAKYHDVDLLAFNQHGLIGPLYPSVAEGINDAHDILGKICRRHKFFDIPSEVQSGGKYRLALKSLVGEPYNIGWLKSQKYAETVASWCEQENYDLVHFDTISLIPFFDKINSSAVTVLDHHNIESHMLLRRADNEGKLLKKFYFKQEGQRLLDYEKKYCPTFSLNITCSDIDTDRLQSLSPASQVTTVPNGVDLNFFQPDSSQRNPKKLVFVGTMNWYPNIEAVLYVAEKLWPTLKNRHPELEFDVIGANPPESILTMARKLDGFNVYGFVDDVRPYINAAALYLCPIQDGGGTKLKILDAMAMEKCIIAHPIACEGIDVTDNENVVFAQDAEAFTQAIERMLENEALATAIGKRARNLMERSYGYTAIGNKLSNLYKDLSARK